MNNLDKRKNDIADKAHEKSMNVLQAAALLCVPTLLAVTLFIIL